MPDVPNVPGVPPLSSYGANNFGLVVSDSVAALSSVLPVQWGIFADGSPVFVPATPFTQIVASSLSTLQTIASLIGLPNVVPITVSFVDFEYAADSPISNYPQEQGAFQSYDKVQLPFDIKVKLACGGSASQRQGFLNTLEALRTSTALLDVVTPEVTYADVNCTHYDFRRTSSNGVTLIVADVWFQNVPISSTAAFSNTQQPGEAGQQSIGNVQPQSPSQATQSIYGSLGGVN